MALSTVVSLSISATITNALNIGSASANLSRSYGASLIDGTVAGAANRAWWDSRTLAASATETLDFAAGGLLDPSSGAVLTFARLKVLVVSASAANTNNVIVGGGATTLAGIFGATTHTCPLRPGQTAMWVAGVADAAGWVIGAGTSDLLAITNSAGTTPVTYEICAIGASA